MAAAVLERLEDPIAVEVSEPQAFGRQHRAVAGPDQELLRGGLSIKHGSRGADPKHDAGAPRIELAITGS